MTGGRAGSLRQAGVRGAFWSIAERWLTRLASLLVLVVLGRLLVPADFGAVAAASVIVDFVGLFTTVGLSTYLVQAREITPSHTSTAFWLSAALGVVLTAVVALTAPWLAFLVGSPEVAPLIRVLSVVVLLGAVVQVPTALLQRRLAFRQLAMRSLTGIVVSSIAAVAVAFAGAGAWALVVQTVTFNLVRGVSVFAVAGWRPDRTFDRTRLREMTTYSGQMFGIGVAQFLRQRGEDVLLATMAGPVALGTWVVSRRLVQIVIELFNGVVQRVATPLFAAAKTDPKRVARGYEEAVRVSACVASPALCILAGTSPTLVPLVFGDHWRVAGVIATYAAVALVIPSASYMQRGLLLALDRADLALKITVWLVVANLTTAAATLAFGVDLVTFAQIMAAKTILFSPLRFFIAREVAEVRVGLLLFDLSRIWLASALGGGSAALVLAVSAGWWAWPALLLAGLVGGLVYLAVLWLVHRGALQEVVRLVLVVRGGRPATTPAAASELSPDSL